MGDFELVLGKGLLVQTTENFLIFPFGLVTTEENIRDRSVQSQKLAELRACDVLTQSVSGVSDVAGLSV